MALGQVGHRLYPLPIPAKKKRKEPFALPLVFSLFFQDFDYKIQNVDVDNDKKEANVSLQLSTLDARTLAEDYAQASLETAILKAAASDTSATEETTDSLEERYVLLDSLLKKNKYETVTRDCTMTLRNTGADHDEWEIQKSHSLENDLVGGLITICSHPKKH